MSRFNIIGTIVSVFSVIYIVDANTNVKLTAPQTNPEYPSKCWDTASQIAYSIGSHNAKNSCQRVHCYPDFRMKYTSCGTHSAASGYTIEQDLTKDYPDCCAKLVRAERKFKRFDVIDASAVKISKFKGRFGGKKIESSTPIVISSTAAPSNENDEEEDIALEREEAAEQQATELLANESNK